ncbi:hypothetical protein D3C75_1166450 [compost metagenome]
MGAVGAALALATFALPGLFGSSELVALRQCFDSKGRCGQVDAAHQCDAEQAKAGLVGELDTGHGASPDRCAAKPRGHASRAIAPELQAVGLFIRVGSFGLRHVSVTYRQNEAFVSKWLGKAP